MDIRRNRVRRVLVAATATFAVALCTSLAGSPEQQQTTAAAAVPMPSRALIDTYCVACHNQRVKTAGVAFDNADLSDVAKDADLWEKALRKLRGGMMPPATTPTPSQISRPILSSAMRFT